MTNLDLSTLKASINPLPHMPIMGSSNPTANKDMISKLWTNEDTIILFSKKHWGQEKIAYYEQFLLFPQCFQKLSVVDVSK